MQDLLLQPLTQSHIQPLVEMSQRSIKQIKPWLQEGLSPTTEQSAMAFVQKFDRDQTLGLAYGFMLQHTFSQKYVGFAFLNHINPTHHFCNLGYWIDANATGKGYATLATKMLIQFATQQLGLKRVELVIEPQNTASIKVAEKAGCQNEGLLKNRIWGEKDAYMYAYCP